MNELTEQFANKLGINDFLLNQFVNNRTLADNLKLESFLTHYQKFTIEQFENFTGPEMKAIEKLEKEIGYLRDDISDLKHELEEANDLAESRNYTDMAPEFDLMVDQQKYDLFMEDYKSFSLEQFETFLTMVST